MIFVTRYLSSPVISSLQYWLHLKANSNIFHISWLELNLEYLISFIEHWKPAPISKLNSEASAVASQKQPANILSPPPWPGASSSSPELPVSTLMANTKGLHLSEIPYRQASCLFYADHSKVVVYELFLLTINLEHSSDSIKGLEIKLYFTDITSTSSSVIKFLTTSLQHVRHARQPIKLFNLIQV